jgi:hypothetical protein
MKILKPNRKEKKEPKMGRGWCSCDFAIVANDGEKCPVCGRRQSKKGRLKKPATPFFDE